MSNSILLGHFNKSAVIFLGFKYVYLYTYVYIYIYIPLNLSVNKS